MQRFFSAASARGCERDMSYGTWLGTHLSALVTVAGGMFAENLLVVPPNTT
jgi:hypothetical protein